MVAGWVVDGEQRWSACSGWTTASAFVFTCRITGAPPLATGSVPAEEISVVTSIASTFGNILQTVVNVHAYVDVIGLVWVAYRKRATPRACAEA